MKSRVVGVTLSILGIFMISIANLVGDVDSVKTTSSSSKTAMDIVNVINISSTNRENDVKLVDTNVNSDENIVELSMEQTPQSVYVPPAPPRVEVYEGMTLEELGEKLNHSLGNGVIGGKGYLIASKCIELGVDPYIATAIMLHETGCKYNCSNLVRTCNNVGGQKGSPSCGGGSYKAYSTIDEGIVGHIENLNRNYFSQGRRTVESIGPKYAESTTWVSKINWYVNQIRAS